MLSRLIPMEILVENLSSILVLIVVILASILTLFLYFRAGRHELVEAEVLFDSAIIAFVGALVGGRIIDFVIRTDFYGWLPKKLFFFNVYGGFDWYGALLGLAIALFLYLKQTKQVNYWLLCDLASAPAVFGALIVSLGFFLIFDKLIFLSYSFGYLIIFWILKRLATTKKKAGFFMSLTLILVSILNLALFNFRNSDLKVFNGIYYHLALPLVTLISGFLIAYLISQRKISNDIKSLMALLLLGLMKSKRILTSKSEADPVAKSIIFLPLSLAKLVVDLVKLLGREVGVSFYELMHAFGIKK